MIGYIKWKAAKFLRGRTFLRPGQITELDAVRWNHLQALIMTKGKVKWDWNKILKKPKKQ
jgi:hypothetical protein